MPNSTGFETVHSESWDTRLFGPINTTGIRLVDRMALRDEVTVYVEVLEPHGMCMTEWKPRMIGCYLMNPNTIH